LVWTLSLVGTLLIPICYWAFPSWQWAILPQRAESPASASVATSAPIAAEKTPSSDDSAIPLDMPPRDLSAGTADSPAADWDQPGLSSPVASAEPVPVVVPSPPKFAEQGHGRFSA